MQTTTDLRPAQTGPVLSTCATLKASSICPASETAYNGCWVDEELGPAFRLSVTTLIRQAFLKSTVDSPIRPRTRDKVLAEGNASMKPRSYLLNEFPPGVLVTLLPKRARACGQGLQRCLHGEQPGSAQHAETFIDSGAMLPFEHSPFTPSRPNSSRG
ncbi:MAG: hypothetical protein ACLRRT_14135 [Ruthenibacterium lactatiformans]